MHIQYVTAAPVSNVLLLRLSGGEYCFVPLRRHRPLTAQHKHSVNVPIEIAARQQDAEDTRARTHTEKKKVDDLCAKISPLNCTHSLLILFALVFFVFLNLCLLFVQACVSPAETGCARGTESKGHEEGREGKLGVGGWSVNHQGAVGRGGCWERSPWSSDLPGDHGAGLRVAGGGGGGAELREAAVARLQAGHGTPAEREEGRGGKERRETRRGTLHHCNSTR